MSLSIWGRLRREAGSGLRMRDVEGDGFSRATAEGAALSVYAMSIFRVYITTRHVQRYQA